MLPTPSLRPRRNQLAAVAWTWPFAALLLAGGCMNQAEPPRSAAADTADGSTAATPTVPTQPNTLEPAPAAMPALPTRQDSVVDDYHGTPIADPYRWLEDTASEETRQWIAAENKLTETYLDRFAGQRADFRRRLEAVWNYRRYGVPSQRQGRLFFTQNDGLQNQPVLFVLDRPSGTPRPLLDPNTLAADGTVSLAGYRPSDDGRLLAYGLAQAGSDWQTWHVRDVETGQDIGDLLQWIKFSGAAWSADGQGFYYGRYDEPAADAQFTATNYYQKLYYHRIGTPQAEDRLVYHRPDEKEWGFSPAVTEDGRWLVISVWRGTEQANQVFYQDLGQPDQPVVELLTGFDASYDFVGNDGRRFWFLTDCDAPRYRLIEVSLDDPRLEAWREILPQTDDVLESVSLVADRFIAVTMHDAHHRAAVYHLDGTLERELQLPGIGSVSGFRGRRDDPVTYYAFTGFTTPGTIYRLDPATGHSAVFRQVEFPAPLEEFVTRQVFYTSRDGTRVPMFLVHHRDLELNGRNPTLLYGYGGFNISLTPGFQPSRVVWLERGAVYAVPNLRGGGEYGRDWHDAGRLANKQNVFDDFIAAAEWLIDQRYTSPRHLAIHGRSNGGLLVGASLVQRPDLFGAAVPSVGVLDMLRFHRYTIGWAWVPEFGSADDPALFPTLLGYSPLHNLRPGTTYPATLITTADHDDRVVPAHSFKFAAALQAAQAGTAPILIRIETSAGHGAGTPTSKQIDEWADIYTFLWSIVGAAEPDAGDAAANSR